MVTKKMKIKSIINYIFLVLSWTLFSILIICAVFLAYYFVAMKLYIAKGDKYKPFFSVYRGVLKNFSCMSFSVTTLA